MDYSRILNKPFLVTTGSWTSAQTFNTTIHQSLLPSAALTNFLSQMPFKTSCLYRMQACVLIQVSGTPMHQGILLATVLPAGVKPIYLNQQLQAPHSFINANESSSVCIEVPFYNRTPLAKTNYDNASFALSPVNYAALNLVVVNPLATSATGSSSLTYTIHLVIKDAEFYVPKNSDGNWVAQSFTSDMFSIPTKIFDGLATGAKSVTGDFIDSMRLGLRELTGFHNPNSPTVDNRMIFTRRNFGNNVDQPSLIEKLDQHAQFNRITQDYVYNTAVDEMDLKTILRKPAYLGTIKVDTSTVSGKVLFAAPITPYIETFGEITNYSAPMRLFYESSRYWRGGLKLHVQSSMTNFQFCKLIVVRDYSGNRKLLNLVPSMTDIHNLMTETFEFSAGGQIQTIELPFCSELEQLECTKQLDVNALSHGMVYIYLLQPLTTNGSVPLSVNFNIYMSAAEDFQFFGYCVDLNFNSSTIPTNAIPVDEISNPKPKPKFVAESNEVTVGISSQEDLIAPPKTPEEDSRFDDFKPMTNVRDYLRRFVPMLNTTAQLGGGKTVIIPLNDIMYNQTLGSALSMNASIRKLFFGFNGGMKFKILVKGQFGGTILYIPPSSCRKTGSGEALATTPAAAWNLLRYPWQSTQLNYSAMTQEIPQVDVIGAAAKGTYSLFEIVIPNMNPYRFMGNSSQYTSTIDTYDCDMGYFVIAGTSATEDLTNIIFYGAYTDETRFGYQVFHPYFSIALAATSTGSKVRDTVFNESTTTGTGINPTIYPGAYRITA